MTDVRTDRPNLDRARAFTRAIGKPTMNLGLVIGILSSVLVIMRSPLMDWYVPYYGPALLVFGAAAWFRTESTAGKAARWATIAMFASGGAYSLWHWAQLLMTSAPVTVSHDTLNAFAFYLMAGPALLVPALLATIRPGWVPLIVVPAILSLATASAVGHGVFGVSYVMRALAGEAGATVAEACLLLGIVLCSVMLLTIAVLRARRV